MSDYLENVIVNATLRGIPFTSPSTVYAALFTTNPTDADIGTEVFGNAYVRMPITFGVPSDGAVANTVSITYPAATGAWGTITHMGIYDSLTSGNLLFHGALSAPKTISGATDVFKFDVGSLVVTLS